MDNIKICENFDIYWNAWNILMFLVNAAYTGSLWSIPLSCRERVSVLDPVVLQM